MPKAFCAPTAVVRLRHRVGARDIGLRRPRSHDRHARRVLLRAVIVALIRGGLFVEPQLGLFARIAANLLRYIDPYLKCFDSHAITSRADPDYLLAARPALPPVGSMAGLPERQNGLELTQTRPLCGGS